MPNSDQCAKSEPIFVYEAGAVFFVYAVGADFFVYEVGADLFVYEVGADFFVKLGDTDAVACQHCLAFGYA